MAMVGVDHMSAEGEDEREEAPRFYVGATRATQRLARVGAGSSLRACRQKAKLDPNSGEMPLVTMTSMLKSRVY